MEKGIDLVDLSIRIPKRFKENTLERFNVKKAKKNGESFIIELECALCAEYYNEREGCKRCLIYIKFHKIFGSETCIYWMDEALMREGITIWRFDFDSSKILWQVSDDDEAKEQLTVLSQKIQELVIWV